MVRKYLTPLPSHPNGESYNVQSQNTVDSHDLVSRKVSELQVYDSRENSEDITRTIKSPSDPPLQFPLDLEILKTHRDLLPFP